MAQYRLIKGTHGRREGGKAGRSVVYKAGVEGRDILDLTPAEVRSFGDRVVPLEPAVADEGAAAVESDGREKATKGKRGGSP